MSYSNEAEVRTLLYLPSALCVISIGGSSCILFDVVNRARTRGNESINTFHRLIACMSIFNIISSLAFSLGNIPVPVDTRGAVDAYGNRISCNLQGFLTVLGLVVPGYNAALALNFLLIIRYGKRDRWVSRYAEPWLHAMVILPPLVTAVTCLYMEAFNFSGSRCFVASAPFPCWRVKSMPCTRGLNAKSLLLVLFSAQIIIFFVILSCSMASIIYWIYQTEKKSDKWHFPRRSDSVFDDEEKTRRRKNLNCNYRRRRELRRSRAVARQAFLYVAAYLLTYIWSYIICVYTETGRRVPFALTFLFSFFYPLQGFFNFLIYRSTNSKKKRPERTRDMSSNQHMRRIVDEQKQNHSLYRNDSLTKLDDPSSIANCCNPILTRDNMTSQTRRGSKKSPSLEPAQPLQNSRPVLSTDYFPSILKTTSTNITSSTRRYSETSLKLNDSESGRTFRRISFEGAQMLSMVAAVTTIDDEDDFMNEIDDQLDATI